jgi:predicted metal-dependent hydrolase
MDTILDIGGISIDVIFKDIKNVHLSVHPPTGRVRIAAPSRMSLESIRLFGISKIAWIKKHQGKIRRQPRETPREYLERESHYVWGHRYLLNIKENESKPGVSLGSRTLELTLPKGAPITLREEVLSEWYRAELRERAATVLEKWAKRLNVDLSRFYIQRMKTKWGSSSPTRGTVRLNLELAKFSPDCLDYVVLHELAHFVAPDHGREFVALLDRHMPGWRTIRSQLNEGPLPTIG